MSGGVFHRMRGGEHHRISRGAKRSMVGSVGEQLKNGPGGGGVHGRGREI